MPLWADSPASPPVTPPPSFPDIDALASRMVEHQDIYQHVRDEALADYAKRNPKPTPTDDKVKTVIRLFAYFCVWEDYYGEDLWVRGEHMAREAYEQGAPDPLLAVFMDIAPLPRFDSQTDEEALKVTRDANTFLAADNPALFKLSICHAALRNLAQFADVPTTPPETCQKDREHFLQQWDLSYSELIKQKLPHDFLFNCGDGVLHTLENHEDALFLAIADIDRDYNELGQAQGRDRMELWFQRGIKVDPNDFGLYKAKEWYLLPRWNGSLEIDMAFGQECVKTGNWAAKLPLILTYAVTESAEGDPAPYKDPEIWAAVTQVYRDYLSRYPNALYIRTSFARHAYESGHMDVALEQLKIMGVDWDHIVISEQMHAQILTELSPK